MYRLPDVNSLVRWARWAKRVGASDRCTATAGKNRPFSAIRSARITFRDCLHFKPSFPAMSNSARLLIAACCAAVLAVLAVLGMSQSGPGRDSAAAPLQSTRPTRAQAARPSATAETTLTSTPDSNALISAPVAEDPTGFPAIEAFRQWAETTAASGIAQVDQNKGMELAKARAAAMKALIQHDPASALRHALPADLRASLPANIASAIEQPVKQTAWSRCASRATTLQTLPTETANPHRSSWRTTILGTPTTMNRNGAPNSDRQSNSTGSQWARS